MRDAEQLRAPISGRAESVEWQFHVPTLGFTTFLWSVSVHCHPGRDISRMPYSHRVLGPGSELSREGRARRQLLSLRPAHSLDFVRERHTKGYCYPRSSFKLAASPIRRLLGELTTSDEVIIHTLLLLVAIFEAAIFRL
jgi:hypothetical protein